MRLLSIFGTRPEAVKMAPILDALRRERAVESILCITAQHRALLDGVLDLFAIAPDIDLNLMEPEQELNRLAARAIDRIDRTIAASAPDRVLVQGDTTTALAAAIAAHQRGVPVAHVEAGLRTYRPDSPWPEELNRRTIDLASDLHFAPSPIAKANLVAERLHGEAFVTGNSGIDALRRIAARLEAESGLRERADAALPPDQGGRLLLVTLHRRESFGAPMQAMLRAIADTAKRAGASIALPVHPNPAVAAAARSVLEGRAGVYLLAPLDLPAFVRLMQRADLVLTDSGGVQEEAVALERPVLVLRDTTERPEAVRAGAAHLVGTDPARIARHLERLLRRDPGRRFARRPHLFGDGQAAGRIVDALLGRPVAEFLEGAVPSAQVTAAAE